MCTTENFIPFWIKRLKIEWWVRIRKGKIAGPVVQTTRATPMSVCTSRIIPDNPQSVVYLVAFWHQNLIGTSVNAVTISNNGYCSRNSYSVMTAILVQFISAVFFTIWIAVTLIKLSSTYRPYKIQNHFVQNDVFAKKNLFLKNIRYN